MKKSVLLFFILFTALWIVFTSNATGIGQFQGTDRTGSPVSAGFCGDCHGSGNYAPTVEITMLDGTTPISEYVPRKKYTMQVRITASAGTPGGYGYQATVLDAKNNDQAGTLGAAPSGQRVISLGGRQYAEHTRRATANVFQMPWTAPAAGVGTLTVYASGMAVNGDNSTANDNSVKDTLTLKEAMSTSTKSSQILAAQIKVYPNPAVEFARVDIEGLGENRQLWVNMLDVQGRVLQHKTLQQRQESAQVTLELKGLPQGQYWVQLSDGHSTKIVSLIK